jgi:hypothetical protein
VRRRSDRRVGDTEAQDRNRSLVLAAVRACAAEQGCTPTVARYFEWRAAGRTNLPSLATTYRLFPQGWQSILEQL